jgi:hypothetical protein
MQRIFSATVVLVLASGFFVTYLGHPWPVLAQTNTPNNSTGANATSPIGKAANNQTTTSQSGTNGKSSTPEATTAVMKGTPKSAGSANQLQRIEGNNTSVISNNTSVGNNAGLVKGIGQESTSTKAKAAGSTPLSKIPVIGKLFPSKTANATAAGPSKTANATAAGPSKTANATAAGPSKTANATAAVNQTSSNSNPLSKIPILGKLFGGK